MTAHEARQAVVRANTPIPAVKLAVLDAPDLVELGTRMAGEVLAWCDDIRAATHVSRTARRTGLDGRDEAIAGATAVWCELPHSLGALDEVAALVAERADPSARLVVLARHTDLTLSMNDVLARHFDLVRGSWGTGKYRALLANVPKRTGGPAWPRVRRDDDLGLDVWAYGPTFAGTRCDPGTRLLADHLGAVPRGDVLDFGSGSGILATLLARRDGQDPARVLAVDVLTTSVAATARTAAAADVPIRTLWADGLRGLPDASLDAIVTNPPFHLGVAKDSTATLAMFADAPRVLRPGGHLWAVYNSHLPWKARLSALVGPTRIVARNPRYTLVQATRR
ncbi:MAG: class I SAM-dependent methyltransferase [Actinomycetia bacterium]|nr:class I SAM-dependent methyltransferase [Actinomycetes bacterium]